jgi:transcriptional regulator with XRE-family HTH domain
MRNVEVTDRSIRVVPGYGESLRSQLAAVRWTQAELADHSQLSRQTISRAINQDEVSERTREKISSALGRAQGAVVRARRGGTAGAMPARRDRRATSPTLFCDATDLEDWAKRRGAQALLPKVVHRLVTATGRRGTTSSFRTDEGIQLHGWDGIVKADEVTAFVPKGLSGWEMGTGAAPKRKAEKDLVNRARDPTPLVAGQSTVVFVTPRRWDYKEKWAREQSNAGPWREVRVIDADDLAHWLEQAPAVHTWLSVQIGKAPAHAIDLESYWENWSGATQPPLTCRFLLSGRDAEAAELRERLADSGGRGIAVRAESRSEAIAAIYCAITELPKDQAESVLARTVVVDQQSALRHLIGGPPPLVLIPRFDAEDLVSAAIRAGHTVVVPLGCADPETDDVLHFRPVFRRKAAEVLKELGFEHGRAYDLARLARRSLSAFRRSIASSPGLRQPEWSRPAMGREVVPALLAGAWSDASDRDQEVLAALAGRPYEEVRDRLFEWSTGADPAVRRRGDSWYLVSSQDAWRLLARYLTHDDLERFKQMVLQVLETVDPAFRLPTGQRWMAGALGYVSEYSGLLARGLVKTIAIMGVHGAAVPTSRSSAQDVAEGIVQQLLEAANRDWRLWASLSTDLRLLAEAAPDAFLDGLEAGLAGPQPTLIHLFNDGQEISFGSCPHVGLLTALESLAWSKDHLARVVSVLAELDEIDPGSERRTPGHQPGRVINRPLRSLTAIFRSWLPETSAMLDERLDVLDRLRRSHSEVAWCVMLSMLPEMPHLVTGGARPKVREWAVDARQRVSRNDQARTAEEVVSRLQADAGTDGRRWTELLDRIQLLPPKGYEMVVGGLAKLDPHSLDQENRTTIWEALLKVAGLHRAFRSAVWAIPENYLSRLDPIRDRFAPSDIVVLHAWLFGGHVHPPDSDDVDETTWDAQQKKLSAERTKAVDEIVEFEGLKGLERLAGSANDPLAAGRAAGRSSTAARCGDDILRQHLASSDASLAEFARGFAIALGTSGDDWVVRTLERTDLALTPTQQAELLVLLPGVPETWQLVVDAGPDTSEAYWRRVRIYSDSDGYLPEAASALLKVGRTSCVLELAFRMHHSKAEIPPRLTAQILEAAVNDLAKPDLSVDVREGLEVQLYNCAGRLLDSLAEADFDDMRVAALEWQLLPMLDRVRDRPEALHRLLSKQPEFFVKVLSLVYPAEDQQSREGTSFDEQRARLGYRLLQSWRRVPGQQDSGRVDGAELREWITGVKSALSDAGLLAVGLEAVGNVLSAGPEDRDGTWPCRPIRDVIEKTASDELENGFRVGVYDSRGAVTKDPADGGAQERLLAARYEGFAAAVRTRWWRTARALRRIARRYRDYARREDRRSEMFEDLGV